MKLSEKIAILENLGILKWLEDDNDADNFRVIINGLAEYFLADSDYFSFMPTCDLEIFDNYFRKAGFDIDWFSLLTGAFARDIEENSVIDIYHNVPTIENTFNYDYDAAKQYIADFVGMWCSNCRKQFLIEINKL